MNTSNPHRRRTTTAPNNLEYDFDFDLDHPANSPSAPSPSVSAAPTGPGVGVILPLKRKTSSCLCQVEHHATQGSSGGSPSSQHSDDHHHLQIILNTQSDHSSDHDLLGERDLPPMRFRSRHSSVDHSSSPHHALPHVFPEPWENPSSSSPTCPPAHASTATNVKISSSASSAHASDLTCLSPSTSASSALSAVTTTSTHECDRTSKRARLRVTIHRTATNTECGQNTRRTHGSHSSISSFKDAVPIRRVPSPSSSFPSTLLPLPRFRRPPRLVNPHLRPRAKSLPADIMNPTTPTTPTHTGFPSRLSASAQSKSKMVDDSAGPSSVPSPVTPSSSEDGSPQQHHHWDHHHRPVLYKHPLSINVKLGYASPSAPSSSSSSFPSPAAAPVPSPVIPPQFPLITRETLKELELEVTLRSPQLRHDLLFDPGLQFRPTSGRRKRDQTERYWEAVTREVEYGCVCTSFDRENRMFPCVCGKACGVASSFKLTNAPIHPSWHPLLRATPSRIVPLLETLKEVLHLVVHPSPSVPAQSPSSAVPPTPSNVTASATHTGLDSLDPELIAQELEHGVFDHKSVFRWIGEVMKLHCAPMRDGMVEAMVRVADEGSNPVRALRMCFEILEVMKLDIANHQLQALRPYLLDTSPDFELKTFQERFEKGVTGLQVSRRWISRAFAAASSISPAPSPRSKLTTTALCSAMVDLVFDPPAPPLAECSPSQHSRSPSGHRELSFPETLYLDHARLSSYVNDASDLLGLYMLIMLFRQLTTPSAGSSYSVEDWEIERVKREVWEVGPSRLGLCFDVSPTSSSKWEKGMVDVMLQIATRAEEARDRMRRREFVAGKLPSQEIMNLIESWQKSSYKQSSPLCKIMKQRLRTAVLDVVKENALSSSPRTNAASTMPMRKVNRHPLAPSLKKSATTTSSSGTGLEPLMPEILHLGERIARLVVFHGKVYGKLYEVEGFVDMSL